jgi:hypothetical protein
MEFCRDIIDDVEKLDVIQDGVIHFQLIRFCQVTFSGFFVVVVELNYCNNSKKKKENGGQDERKEKS